MANSGIDGYSYYISNDSDEEDLHLNSSDDENLDEVEVFLRGTPEQKRKVLKCLTGDEASSSDDDFEKVMQGELEAKVKAMEDAWKQSDVPNACSSAGVALGNSSQSAKKPKYYDDIYFDSDDEDKAKKQRLTDDELFYDPSADDEDQKWVDKQQKRLKRKKADQGKRQDTSKLPRGSDAVLNCPACMTTLCVDCQRHTLYQNQYRAMFVMNCDVKFDELLHYKEKKKKQFKRHKKGAVKSVDDSSGPAGMSMDSFTKASSSDSSHSNTDGYHPVKCSICGTEVAVYDSDEIYHFFNVLTGYA